MSVTEPRPDAQPTVDASVHVQETPLALLPYCDEAWRPALQAIADNAKTAGVGSELRVRSTLHVNSRLEPGTTVPIGWVAAGDPAELFSPDRHDELWAVQEPLDFPGTVYGVARGTSMREIMRRQSAAFGRDG